MTGPANDIARILYRGDYDYATLEGASITTLKELRNSPKHYRHRLKHPRKSSAQMELGTVAHIAVLEPERFLKEYVLWQAKDADGSTRQRRGKVYDAFCEANTGKSVVRDEEYDEAISMRESVRRDPIAMKYLAQGEPEVALQWVDDLTGLNCRGRVDWYTQIDGGPCIVDLKTTRNAEPLFFSRDVAKMDYHLQLAYYSDAVQKATGKQPRVVIVAVESFAPYDVVTYVVPDDVLEIGRDAYHGLLEKLKVCQALNHWPGKSEDQERVLQLPSWAVPDEENDDMQDLDWGNAA